MGQVVRRRRVKTRNLSAEIIKTMLKETAFLSNVNRAIRRFRLYVIMVQRHVKGWLECCRAENKMMLRQVERVEKAEVRHHPSSPARNTILTSPPVIFNIAAQTLRILYSIACSPTSD